MNPLVILFLALSVFGAGSAALARYEMKRADLAEDHLKTAIEANAKMHENEVKTGEITDAYEKNITDLNRKLSANRMRKSGCIVPAASPAIGSDGRAGNGKPVGSMGISEAFMDELVAEGARYQEQLRFLQQYVRATCSAP